MEAQDDAGFRIAVGVDTGHQIQLADLFRDGNHAFAANQVGVLTPRRRAVVLP